MPTILSDTDLLTVGFVLLDRDESDLYSWIVDRFSSLTVPGDSLTLTDAIMMRMAIRSGVNQADIEYAFDTSAPIFRPSEDWHAILRAAVRRHAEVLEMTGRD